MSRVVQAAEQVLEVAGGVLPAPLSCFRASRHAGRDPVWFVTACNGLLSRGMRFMAEHEQAPPDIDMRTPNMARMYDYALGGKDNFASDREAVQNLFQLAPENAY